MGMIREGLASSSRSKNSKSTRAALREYRLKFTPPSRSAAPNGELRPKSSRGPIRGGQQLNAAGCAVVNLQYFQNLFVPFERWNQIRAGHLRTRPAQHFPGDFEAAIERRSYR